MPAVLDVAIGVVFVFLLFSLVVSALNEVILSFLDKRAAFLREGLTELLRDTGNGASEEGRVFVTLDSLMQHGLISVLSRGTYQPAGKAGSSKSTAGVPSYIPGKSFVLALLSLVTNGRNPALFRDLGPTIDALGNKELRETLRALYDDARGDLDHFKANIENWFNESMDRVGGWYKRYAQQWLLGLSLVLAVICNVDTVRIVRALSLDPTLRSSIVQQAETYAQATPATAAEAQADDANPAVKLDKFKGALADLGGAGIPMGWNDGPSQQLLSSLPKPGNFVSPGFWEKNLVTPKTTAGIVLWLSSIIGWGITGLAASLGAPFWFDMLNRVVDIRGVGRAPEEGDKTAPKKPATGIESYVISGDSLLSANGGNQTAAAVSSGMTSQTSPDAAAAAAEGE